MDPNERIARMREGGGRSRSRSAGKRAIQASDIAHEVNGEPLPTTAKETFHVMQPRPKERAVVPMFDELTEEDRERQERDRKLALEERKVMARDRLSRSRSRSASLKAGQAEEAMAQ